MRRRVVYFKLYKDHAHRSSLSSGNDYSFCSATVVFVDYLKLFITMAASSGKRSVKVWRPSVRLSLCPVGAYSTWLTRRQHATRPACISVRDLRGLTYLFSAVPINPNAFCLLIYSSLRRMSTTCHNTYLLLKITALRTFHS